MRFSLVALGLALFANGCGTDDKKESAPPPADFQCGFSSDNVCDDEWFTDPSNQDPFDPSDPNNQDPFPGNPGDDRDDDDDDGKSGPSKSKSKLYLTSVNSFENLKKKNNGSGYFHDGRCHVKVEASSYGFKVRIRRSDMKNQSVGLGQSRSCLVNLGLRYREGYKFTVSKIYMDLMTDIERNSEGRFELDYNVKSRGSTLEYRKTVDGPQKKRHDLSLTPKSTKWSSCRGKETIGLDTFFETNYQNSPSGKDSWKRSLEAKNRNRIDHGDLYLDEGEFRIKIKWAKCD